MPRTTPAAEDVHRTATDGSITLAALFEQFLAFSAARGRSPTTLHGYRSAIRGFWVPALGATPIDQLSTHQLDVLYASLLTRERPASPATVRKYHAILSAALSQAVKWGWLASNPARLATLPSKEHRAVRAPTEEQVRALIVACGRDSELLGLFVRTAAVTGCRRGELAALRWADLDGAWLHVRGSAYSMGHATKGIKQTKTGRERRVRLDDALVERLVQWRSSCAAAARRADAELADASFVFPSGPDARSPVNVNTISAQFRRVAVRLGLATVHFHSLRHFAATQLISGGLDPRSAASRLGHTNPSMTLSIYAHATAESEERAAAISAGFLERDGQSTAGR